jgi:hypothetical protein
MNIIINKYIDSIQNATSMTNLEMKLKPILARNFRYNIYGIYGNIAGRKTSFYRNLYPRMKLYQDDNPKITEKMNDKEKEKYFIIIFKYKDKKIKQYIYLEGYLIKEVIEEILKPRRRRDTKPKKGGMGYTVDPTPIAGQPTIRPYQDCCRPIYKGQLTTGGSRIMNYYLKIGEGRLNVQPQYGANIQN